jgi:hypothetical protein
LTRHPADVVLEADLKAAPATSSQELHNSLRLSYAGDRALLINYDPFWVSAATWLGLARPPAYL